MSGRGRAKAFGNNIMNRLATLRYEVGKALQDKVQQFDTKSYPKWLSDIFASKTCMYCGSNLKKKDKNKGDHLISVIADKKPRGLNNFSKLTVPCCSDCNASKGKLTWLEHLDKNPSIYTEERRAMFEKIEAFINENIYYSYYDESEYNDIMTVVDMFLRHVMERVQNMQVTSYEPEFAFPDYQFEH